MDQETIGIHWAIGLDWIISKHQLKKILNLFYTRNEYLQRNAL